MFISYEAANALLTAMTVGLPQEIIAVFRPRACTVEDTDRRNESRSVAVRLPHDPQHVARPCFNRWQRDCQRHE